MSGVFAYTRNSDGLVNCSQDNRQDIVLILITLEKQKCCILYKKYDIAYLSVESRAQMSAENIQICE